MFKEEDGVRWLDFLTGEERVGIILNTSFCAIKGTWYLLVASTGEDRQFYTLDVDSPEVQYVKIMSEMEFYGGPDDDDDDSVEEGEDE
jgi:hypothetical protein